MPLIDYSFLRNILPKGRFKKQFRHARRSYLRRVRIAVSLFYFGMGFCFASWASRIPDIKQTLGLSEGELGTLLFALPMGQLVAMPFSGKTVTRYGSKAVVMAALCFYAVALCSIGFATTTWQLALALFFFGLGGNFSNIAVNTQGVYAEELYGKTIMGSFHGSWSLAGFCGALFGLLMMGLEVDPFEHFLYSGAIVLFLILFNHSFLVRTKKANPAELEDAEVRSRFSFPPAPLLWLGLIGFCCMASEGVMFDWSGVYFRKIVKAPGALAALGYTSFMVMMATGRFLSDFAVARFGRKAVLQVSGCAISIGLLSAVAFPYLVPCVIAFMVVGLGVATVVPSVYSLAGKNGKIPPGEALTAVSSVSFLGFLLGPPFIGYIAEAFGLKWSFAIIGTFGFFITLMVSKLPMFRASQS
ncbi:MULTISPECIES: MFS transporter [unclassified Flavobacterium]|uniref:MFS transporter n=1 Tax=unclassified Flavobacterium TaxID=196869 RepID=UPI001F141DC3|nr:MULTISPECIES: MFS transporter [unclassified Flavobacterium]UMY67234.1 MFS transporter [Flavobacterium sp. HJ-32-4]